MEAAELSARTRTIGQLANIVQAMRTLASAEHRQADERFSGLERYVVATRAALREALALLTDTAPIHATETAPTGCRVVVLFSEHGFVGALNERVLDAALALSRSRSAELVAVGGRGFRLCRERGVAVTNGGSMPTTVPAAQATAQRLIEGLFGEVAAGRLGEIHAVLAGHRPPFGWEPQSIRLFPPDVHDVERAVTDDAPLIHTLEPSVLAVRAIEEYAFALVSWAVASAFTSEQAARFVAMDAAHHAIEDKLSELRALERRLRQETITSEILEIASGAEPWEIAT